MKNDPLRIFYPGFSRDDTDKETTMPTNPTPTQQETLELQRTQDFELAKSLVRDWLMEKGVALTGVNGEASRSTINRFKLDIALRIARALTAVRKETRAAAFKEVIGITENERVDADSSQHAEDYAYNRAITDVVEAIQAATNTEEGAGDG